MSRKAHSKTRSGCSQCKRRRVKCDLIRPICSHCARRQETCEYTDIILQGQFRSRETWPCSMGARPISNRDTGTYLEAIESPQPGGLEHANQTPLPNVGSKSDYAGCELNINQLKIMHNWYDQAAQTMALDDSQARVAFWSREVPILAFANPFLMHGILAISSAHIAYTSSSAEIKHDYLLVARQHHELGYRLYQHLGSPESSPHTQSVAEAKAVFMLLNTALSLALTKRTGCAEQDLNAFIDWLIHLRSLFELAHESYRESSKYGESRISILLRRSEDGPSELLALDEGLTTSFDLLSIRNRTNESTSPVDKEHLSGAIAQVKLWMRLVSTRPRTALFIATCVNNLTKDFFRLVKERNPVALTLMSHFLVPMCHAPRKWFWSDWFDVAMAAIIEILSIDEWHNNIAWVLEQKTV